MNAGVGVLVSRRSLALAPQPARAWFRDARWRSLLNQRWVWAATLATGFGEREERVRMYVVHNRIEVPPEGAEAFEKAFTESMRSTLGGVPGLRRSLLLRPAVPRHPYVSTMEFDSQADFRAWLQSDSFRAAHSDVQAPSAIESFDLVADVVG